MHGDMLIQEAYFQREIGIIYLDLYIFNKSW